MHRKIDALEDAGHSVVVVGNDDHVCGFISVADSVRDNALSIVADLKRAGVEKVIILTGDNQGTARAISGKIGADEFHAELLPEDKLRAIEELKGRYGSVAMVGDGINDAPALAAATLGIAMGAAGTDAAMETADIALMSDDLSRLPWLIRHGRRTLGVIRQNIALCARRQIAVHGPGAGQHRDLVDGDCGGYGGLAFGDHERLASSQRQEARLILNVQKKLIKNVVRHCRRNCARRRRKVDPGTQKALSIKRQSRPLKEQGKGGDPSQKGAQGQIFIHLRKIGGKGHDKA